MPNQPPLDVNEPVDQPASLLERRLVAVDTRQLVEQQAVSVDGERTGDGVPFEQLEDPGLVPKNPART